MTTQAIPREAERGKSIEWFRSLSGKATHSVRLCVFPHAGGATAAFRSWTKHLPDFIDLRALQLAGREARFSEEPCAEWSEIVAEAAAAIASDEQLPLVFFGHSMGSILAFEVARTLRRAYGIHIAALVVSGRCAPSAQSRTPPMRHLEGRELVVRLGELYDAIPNEALEEPELVQLMARVLSADIKVVEDYRYAPETPLSCPLTAFGGQSDPWATKAELAGWSAETSAAFMLEQFRGAHFYLRASATEAMLLERIGWICREVNRGGPAAW